MKTLTLAFLHVSFLTLVALLTFNTSHSITQDYPANYMPNGYEKPLFNNNVNDQDGANGVTFMPILPGDNVTIIDQDVDQDLMIEPYPLNNAGYEKPLRNHEGAYNNLTH